MMLETDVETDNATCDDSWIDKLPTIDDTELNDRETAEACVETAAIDVLLPAFEVLTLTSDDEIPETLRASEEISLEIDDDSPGVKAACAAVAPSHELIFE